GDAPPPLPVPPPPPPRETATPAPPQVPPQPAPLVLSSDTPKTTSLGTTYTAPAGWTLTDGGSYALITGPEADLHVGIVDSKEQSADDAVAAAWRVLRPDFKRPLKMSQPRPGRHGWDERKMYDYETSPDEKVFVRADAYRHGAKWTVLLVESGQASI